MISICGCSGNFIEHTSRLVPAESEYGEGFFYVRGSVGAYERPLIYPSVKPDFMAQGRVEILSVTESGKLYKIENSAGRVGWIPSWYLNKDLQRDKIHLVKPKEMTVKATTRFCLYPGEEEPSGFELSPGKVVHVKEKYREWYNVEIITYDTPYVGDKWVKKSNLIHYSPSFAREGYLKPGANVYEEYGTEETSKDQYNFRNNPVIINEVRNDMYGISTAGGVTGFIKKDDFVPNPFVEGNTS